MLGAPKDLEARSLIHRSMLTFFLLAVFFQGRKEAKCQKSSETISESTRCDWTHKISFFTRKRVLQKVHFHSPIYRVCHCTCECEIRNPKIEEGVTLMT